MRFGLGLIIAGAAALMAVPCLAVSSPYATFYAAGHAAQTCARAAAAAQTTAQANEAGVSACSTAILMAANSDARLAAAYTNRAILHLVRGEYRDSLADSDSALQIDNLLTEAVVNHGVAMLMLHRPGEAASDFTRALSLSPASPAKIYFNRAMAREDSGDLRGAYGDYLQASKMEPQWDRPRQELSRFTVTPRTPVS